MAYKIGQLAALARVSVRTLHHYDALKLVTPSGRAPSGYRLYTERDLERLQQVLFHRALGFPLEQIARLLAEPGFDRRSALLTHRAQLLAEAEKTAALLQLIDRTLACIDQGTTMEAKAMFEGFDPAAYEAEAEQRWGQASAWAESKARTSRYTAEDWAALRAEADALNASLAALLREGARATEPRAMDLAEQHKQHVERWFYRCSYERHVGLGELYANDPRFAAYYEKHAPGLARFLCDAIEANSKRAR